MEPFDAVVVAIEPATDADCESPAVRVWFDILDQDTGTVVVGRHPLGGVAGPALVSESWFAERGLEVGSRLTAQGYQYAWCVGGDTEYEVDLSLEHALASC